MDEKLLNKILDFTKWYSKYEDKELIKKYILDHIKFGTFDCLVDTEGNVIGVCRWNVSEDGKVADICDFIIKEEYRNKGFGTDFIVRAMKRFKDIEYLTFKRGYRKDMRPRKLSIKSIIKRRIL